MRLCYFHKAMIKHHDKKKQLGEESSFKLSVVVQHEGKSRQDLKASTWRQGEYGLPGCYS